MTAVLALDAEAMSVLAGPPGRASGRRAASTAAARLRRDVVAPAVVLAELYRGPRRSELIDACLSSETGIAVRVTDRPLARLVGGVLATAGADTTMIVDAHVVATTVEAGRGVVLTSDPSDIELLAGPYPNIVVVDIGGSG